VLKEKLGDIEHMPKWLNPSSVDGYAALGLNCKEKFKV
jgi:hypothetical protein